MYSFVSSFFSSAYFWNSFMLLPLSIDTVNYQLKVNYLLIFHFTNIPQFVYPFMCWWAFNLFPVFDYYGWRYHEYLHTSHFGYSYSYLFLLGKYLGFKFLGCHCDQPEAEGWWGCPAQEKCRYLVGHPERPKRSVTPGL